MKIQVDVVSDVVCPWCFIGKHRLEAALDQLRNEYPGLQAQVRWHPFQLNPDTPDAGDPYLPFLERKFGGREQVQRIWARVEEAGGNAGIGFAFQRIAIRPNTLRAHRLIHRAQDGGQDASALVERLFAGHFEEGEDIGNPDVLARLAADVGEDRESALAYLASDEDGDTVCAMIRRAAEMGISGVPFFIFNRRVAVAGAQPPEELADAIRHAISPAEAAG